MADPAPPPPRRRARRVAQAVYWAMVGLIGLACAVQITLQALFQPVAKPPYTSCHEGLRKLHEAVARARQEGAGTDGEDAALLRFRAALSPEWGYRDGIAALCRGAERDEGALDAIERLRYAEEHAVRREAGELAPLRRRVQAIVDRELGPSAPPSPGPPSPAPPPP